LALCSSIYYLKSLRASRTSVIEDCAMETSRSASSKRAMSRSSVNQDLMKMLLSGYSWKFSAILSTMIILEISRPIRDKSLT
jgi:hypothetical protein